MAGGYIKLYRQMCDWEWYGDANVFRVFLHLLLNAQHEDTRWQGKVVQRGQVVIGREKLSEDLKLSVRQIRTALAKLESTGEITKKSTNKYTIVSICKWDNYQVLTNSDRPTNDQQMTNKRPTNDHIQECKEYKEINNISSTSSREENFFSELGKTDTEFFTLVCMRLSIDSVLYEDLLQDFIQECKMRDKWHLSMQDAKNHFVDWSRKELERRSKPKQQNNGVQAKYDPTGSYEPKSTREDYFL